MSRFSGWTMKDIERLTGGSVEVKSRPKVKRKIKASGPDHVGMISSALTVLGVEHEREYKFLHDRRFKFDIALPKQMVAVEFEGGIFSGGRHVRGKGYANDAKKYNLATRHGWRLLRYTTADTSKLNWEFRVAGEIKNTVEENIEKL